MQLRDALAMVDRPSSSFSVLAGDLNLRAWEAQRAKVAEDGGRKWSDAWHHAGADPNLAGTWRDARYDRILLRRAPGGTDAAEFVGGCFHLEQADESDHRGVCCAIRLPSESESGNQTGVPGVAFPLRRGLRGRVGDKGVARRPTKL